MTSREVTRFYLVTKSTLYDFKRLGFTLCRRNQLSMKSTEVTWFYIVTKSTLSEFKRSY